jgi:hypothetical protein
MLFAASFAAAVCDSVTSLCAVFELDCTEYGVALRVQVIAATNIAETSVTIEGTVYVIDCMFSKQKVGSPAGAPRSVAPHRC